MIDAARPPTDRHTPQPSEMMMTQRFTGIHAVLYALFQPDGHLWRDGMRQQVERCLASGVDGIVVLGLATEVAKLTEAERRQVIDWAVEDIAGRKPLGATIYGNSVIEQIELLGHAQDAGANWLILQPPVFGAYGAAETIRTFGSVADAARIPVAIQNAPALMGRGLTGADIATLVERHPVITHLKGEMPVLEVERIVAAGEGRLVVLNGQGGLEMMDNIRAGAEGFVLAPDVVDKAVLIWRAMQAGDEQLAEALYQQMLPASVFGMRSLEHLLVYGKRIFGLRTGLQIADRAPSLPTSDFGLMLAKRYADAFGAMPG